MKLSVEQAIEIIDTAIFKVADRRLTSVEVMVLRGTWECLDYDQMAAQNQYATSYISQDVAPKLWKLLSKALGEKVKKSNLRKIVEQRWAIQYDAADQSPEFVESIYIGRAPVESLCYGTLLKPSALVRIKAAKLMGKTSLVSRILRQLEIQQGYRTVLLSFELADRQTHFTNLSRFLRWFCLNLTRELALPDQLDEYWNEEGMGAKVSCTTYLEQYLLAEIDEPLVLVLDDADLLFPHPEVYEDFFGLLRSWHEKSRLRKQWQQLRLVIVHSTDIYIRLNINQSPFNVGVPIELPEFTLTQAQDLARQHRLSPDVAEPLLGLVGGHPYLLEQAFLFIKTHQCRCLDELLKTAPTEAGIYSSHLRQHWSLLQQEPTFLSAIQQILKSEQPVKLDPVIAYQLQGSGLIQLDGNVARLRCKLYQQYFSNLMQPS